MTDETRQRLWGAGDAFDHPVTVGITVAVGAAWLLAWGVVGILGWMGRLPPGTALELRLRLKSWAILIPLMMGPVLLGAAWTMAAVAVLSDQPKGYIQRVALGCFGFLLFGVCLGHLGYMANDVDYRPIILLLLLGVELNDVFAYLAGKSFGRRKLAPHTSPGKTMGGMAGALVGTTTLVAVLGHLVFAGSAMEGILPLIGLGLVISVAGQLGDLVLSSIKRDLGLKDMGRALPGHGGLLDRFDSLILVAPAFFHYVGYFRGFGLEQPTRIFTGG